MLAETAPWPAFLLAAQFQAHGGALWALLLVTMATGAGLVELSRRMRRSALEPSERHEALAPLRSSPGLLGSEDKPGLLSRLLPEACGLALGLAVASCLLLYGSDGAQDMTAEDQKLWHSIKTAWPRLITADSLLGLQAMLRMLLLTSAAFRVQEALSSPLSGFPSAFLLLAAYLRVVILAMSPRDIYHLDGPLGGTLNVVLEVGALALLLYLAFAQMRRAERSLWLPALATMALSMALAWIACENRLAIAEPEQWYLDAFFSLKELLELAASITFLANAARSSVEEESQTAFGAFAHVVLPLQQVLSAYFLLAAWGHRPLEEDPALVGAGRPFELLQLAGVLEVGAYLLSPAVALAACRGEESFGGVVEV